MMATRLCFLNNTGDVEQFLDATPDLREWTLVATHPAVSDALEARGLGSVEISEFLDLEDQRRLKEGLLPGGALHQRLEGILAGLDKLAPGDAWNRLGLSRPVSMLSSMYRYLLAHGLWGLSLFETAFSRLIAGRTVTEVAVFESTAGPAFFTPYEAVCHALANALGITARTIAVDGRERHRPVSAQPLPKREGEETLVPPEPKEAVAPHVTAQRTGTLLLFLPEYDLYPLLAPSLPFNVLTWPLAGLPAVEGVDLEPLRARARALIQDIVEAFMAGPVPGLMPSQQRRLGQDLAENGEEKLMGLALMDQLVRQGRVNAIAWGNSPGADNSRALWLEYGMRSGLPVLGMQHGGNNGVQDCGYLSVLGEYAYCTHLFGYGYDREDIPPRLAEEVRSEILPIGSTRLASLESLERYRPVSGRVVFPATNCLSLLRNARVAPAFLSQAQRVLIEALDARPDLDVWIKPLPCSSTANFARREQLAAVSNVRVTTESFSKFLTEMHPQLVVVEYPSSPLFDALPYDVDIFLLFDPLYPFSAQAEAMLRRRAHVFSTPEEMARAIAAYGKELLPRLRSREYYERYIARPGAAERLVGETTRLVWGENPVPQAGGTVCNEA